MKDLHNNIKISRLISAAAIISANGTTTSEIIDTADYDSLELAVQSGVITDGSFTCTVYEGDEADMSDEAAVADENLVGTEPSFAASEDNTVKKVGYIGNKRYVRLKAVQAGASTGGFLSAVAVQGHAKRFPVD